MKLLCNIFLTLVITFLAGCLGSQKSTDNKKPESEKGTIPTIRVDKNAQFEQKTAPFNMETINIIGDTLVLEITYSGGCKTHQFELVTSLGYQKSSPPKLPVVLLHHSGGEACREKIKETLRFNISELKYPGENSVVLILPQKKHIEYVY